MNRGGRREECKAVDRSRCSWQWSPASGEQKLGHKGERCSFDAFLDKYRLDDPALGALALIVRGADTDARHLAPEAAGLYAVASGFREISRDDHENMARQFPVYDALYAFCRAKAR